MQIASCNLFRTNFPTRNHLTQEMRFSVLRELPRSFSPEPGNKFPLFMSFIPNRLILGFVKVQQRYDYEALTSVVSLDGDRIISGHSRSHITISISVHISYSDIVLPKHNFLLSSMILFLVSK